MFADCILCFWVNLNWGDIFSTTPATPYDDYLVSMPPLFINWLTEGSWLLVLRSSEFLAELVSSFILIFILSGLPELHSSLLISFDTDLSFGLVLEKWPEFLKFTLFYFLPSNLPLLLVIVSLTETRPFSVVMFSDPSCNCCEACLSLMNEVSVNLSDLLKLYCDCRLASAILDASFSPLRPPRVDRVFALAGGFCLFCYLASFLFYW